MNLDLLECRCQRLDVEKWTCIMGGWCFPWGIAIDGAVLRSSSSSSLWAFPREMANKNRLVGTIGMFDIGRGWFGNNVVGFQRRRGVPVLNCQRTPKDPSSYGSIEEIRRELENAKGQAPFSLTKTIQWLGDAANNGGGSLAFRAYSWVLGLDQPAGWRAPLESPEDEMQRLRDIEEGFDPVTLRQLEVVLLMSRQSVLKLVSRCPQLEKVDAAELMGRMMELKRLFPKNDVARMVELVPSGFLVRPWEETYVQLVMASDILRSGLEGADVDGIFDEDPTILFEEPESLRIGIRRMDELWNINEEMLSNSSCDELALAIRALGIKGAPNNINEIGGESH